MRVERIDSADFADLADCWNCLTRGVPFRSWTWADAWWRHFRQGRELYLLTVRDDHGQLVGAAPWFLEETRTRGRVLRFLGSGEAGSDYLSLLATAEHEDAVTKAIAQWLITANERKHDRWDLLELGGVSEADRTVGKLVAALHAEGYLAYQSPLAECWRIELPGDWEEYLATMSKSHRKQVRRIESRLLHTGRATLHTLQHHQDISHGLRILSELHERRAASLHDRGSFASPQFAAFYREVMPRLWAEQRLQLHWVEIEELPVAAELHLLGSAVSYSYLAGIDPDYLDDEPGRLLHIATLKQAIAEGQYSLDFLHGDQPFKAHWRAQSRRVSSIRIVPPRTGSQVRHSAWRMGETMRSWLKAGFAMKGLK